MRILYILLASVLVSITYAFSLAEEDIVFAIPFNTFTANKLPIHYLTNLHFNPQTLLRKIRILRYTINGEYPHLVTYDQVVPELERLPEYKNAILVHPKDEREFDRLRKTWAVTLELCPNREIQFDQIVGTSKLGRWFWDSVESAKLLFVPVDRFQSAKLGQDMEARLNTWSMDHGRIKSLDDAMAHLPPEVLHFNLTTPWKLDHLEAIPFMKRIVAGLQYPRPLKTSFNITIPQYEFSTESPQSMTRVGSASSTSSTSSFFSVYSQHPSSTVPFIDWNAFPSREEQYFLAFVVLKTNSKIIWKNPVTLPEENTRVRRILFKFKECGLLVVDEHAKPDILEKLERMNEEEDGCPICLDEMALSDSNPPVQLRCGHLFHKECVKKQIAIDKLHRGRTSSCSLCRRPIHAGTL